MVTRPPSPTQNRSSIVPPVAAVHAASGRARLT
jgi:hypothetical protein